MASLSEVTFKKVNTIGELRTLINELIDENGISKDEPLFMLSDEEGNGINKVLCLEYTEEGITLVPWENYE